MPGTPFTVDRCDCGGRLERATEQTERGPRWYHTCPRCGTRWDRQGGTLLPCEGPSQRGDGDGGLTPSEAALLAWFRDLPRRQQAAVVFHVRNLALLSAPES